MPRRYTETEARAAIAASSSYTEALRRLGLTQSGGNRLVLARWAETVWGISTAHFDGRAATVRGGRSRGKPLAEVLVRDSNYSRKMLKRRLYAEGLKQRRCEMCGQGETWCGRHMALILDHVNGDPRDNRIENLRIVCPNCAATLDTHCGRKNLRPLDPRSCQLCGASFVPKRLEQRYCSRRCGQRWPHTYTRPGGRKVQWPLYEELLRQVAELGWSGTGRLHGVSDNAVRKWVRRYERERESEGGVISPPGSRSAR